MRSCFFVLIFRLPHCCFLWIIQCTQLHLINKVFKKCLAEKAWYHLQYFKQSSLIWAFNMFIREKCVNSSTCCLFWRVTCICWFIHFNCQLNKCGLFSYMYFTELEMLDLRASIFIDEETAAWIVWLIECLIALSLVKDVTKSNLEVNFCYLASCFITVGWIKSNHTAVS